MWTNFYDMRSGRGQKLWFSELYVELPKDKAIQWFEATFDRCPYNGGCECCGEDYTVEELEHSELDDSVRESLRHREKVCVVHLDQMDSKDLFINRLVEKWPCARELNGKERNHE